MLIVQQQQVNVGAVFSTLGYSQWNFFLVFRSSTLFVLPMTISCICQQLLELFEVNANEFFDVFESHPRHPFF